MAKPIILYIKSNKLSTRSYSASSRKVVMRSDWEISKLDPNWVTGFIDGEGSFTCSVVEDERLKTGWEVKSYFQIKLHERDKPVLVEIQKSLGVGKI